MQSYQIRRAAIVLLGVVLVVFIVVQSVSWFGNLTRRGLGGSATETAADMALTDLAENDSRVSLTYSGPIVARENYQQIRMSVSASQRILDIIDGYGQAIGRRVVLGNDADAFSSFLRALSLNDFGKSQNGQIGPDERGACFEGKRVVGQVFSGGQQLSRLWAASCSIKMGTMDARWQDILELFQDQFPSYDEQTEDVDF